MYVGPLLTLSPGSPLRAALTEEWSLVPLRIPGGWSVQWNTFEARLNGDRCEIDNGEDLLLIDRRFPPPNGTAYDRDRDSPWRELHLDLGWYRDEFCLRMLDPDWDHAVEHHTDDIDEVVDLVHAWLRQPPAWHPPG